MLTNECDPLPRAERKGQQQQQTTNEKTTHKPNKNVIVHKITSLNHIYNHPTTLLQI